MFLFDCSWDVFTCGKHTQTINLVHPQGVTVKQCMTDEDVSSFPIVLCLGDFLEPLLLLCQGQLPHLDPRAYSS